MRMNADSRGIGASRAARIGRLLPRLPARAAKMAGRWSERLRTAFAKQPKSLPLHRPCSCQTCVPPARGRAGTPPLRRPRAGGRNRLTTTPRHRPRPAVIHPRAQGRRGGPFRGRRRRERVWPGPSRHARGPRRGPTAAFAARRTRLPRSAILLTPPRGAKKLFGPCG